MTYISVVPSSDGPASPYWPPGVDLPTQSDVSTLDQWAKDLAFIVSVDTYMPDAWDGGGASAAVSEMIAKESAIATDSIAARLAYRDRNIVKAAEIVAKTEAQIGRLSENSKHLADAMRAELLP